MKIACFNILLLWILGSVFPSGNNFIYGKWIIINVEIPYITSMTDKEMNSFIGKEIKINKSNIQLPFEAPLDSCPNPKFRLKKEFALLYFYKEWRDHVTKKSLGITSDSMNVITISCPKASGKYQKIFNLIAESDTTMILDNYRGAFFWLKKLRSNLANN